MKNQSLKRKKPFLNQFVGFVICFASIAVITFFFNVGFFNLIAIFSLILASLSNSNAFSKDKRTLKSDGSRVFDVFTVTSYAIAFSVVNLKLYLPFDTVDPQLITERWIVGVTSLLCYAFVAADAIISYFKNKKVSLNNQVSVDQNLNVPNSDSNNCTSYENPTEVIVVKTQEAIPIDNKAK
ncbi:hypothetical protein [Pantoea ananatis]|uniref:hypothetical protein n=1 Tax=Pantoea ananas TaxID=553 RepID=UPI003017ADE8